MGKSFKLRNGLLLLSTEAPGGVYNASQLKKIAALCEGDSAIAKATEDQRLAIFAAPEKAAQIAKELRAVGLGVRHYQDGLHQPINCIGELCGEHQQDAMGASMDLARSLGGIVLTSAPLKIGINGCGRCCVPTHTLDISVVGESQGYRLSMGGRSAQLPELATYIAEGIPPEELPDLLTKVVNLYKNLAQPGESLQDVLERCGSRPFLEALAPYSQDGFGADSQDVTSESSDSGLDPHPEADAPLEGADAENADVALEDLSIVEDHEFIDEESVNPPSGAGETWDNSSANMSSPLKTPKKGGDTRVLSTPVADLEHDLMDGLPGFDPSLEGGESASGPTIDGLDLVGDGHGSLGLEPELLEEEFPQDESIPLLEDQGKMADPGVAAVDREGQAELGQDTLLPEGPIAPVEEDFDAQQALSDDFEDPIFADHTDESIDSGDQNQLEVVAGIDPIESLGTSTTTPPPSQGVEAHGSATPVEAILEAGDEFDAEKGAEEVDGSDADELEAKLAASIAAEESIAPLEDENAAARMEALNIIAGESLPRSNSVESALDVPEDFSDLQIDSEPQMAPEVLEAPDIHADDFELEEFEVVSDEQKQSAPLPEDMEEAPSEAPVLPVESVKSDPVSQSRTVPSPGLKAAPTPPPLTRSEDVSKAKDAGNGERQSHPAPSQPQSSANARKEPPRSSGSEGFSLSGVDLIGDGRVSLAFASGMSLVVDPRTIAPGMTKGFNFGGQRINITAADHGLNVEVDGVTIFLPVAA